MSSTPRGWLTTAHPVPGAVTPAQLSSEHRPLCGVTVQHTQCQTPSPCPQPLRLSDDGDLIFLVTARTLRVTSSAQNLATHPPGTQTPAWLQPPHAPHEAGSLLPRPSLAPRLPLVQPCAPTRAWLQSQDMSSRWGLRPLTLFSHGSRHLLCISECLPPARGPLVLARTCWVTE